MIEEEIPVFIAFPPGISDGDTSAVALDPLGIPGRRLMVRFKVV